MPQSFKKHPSETYAIDVDYTDASPTGAVLSSGIWSVIDQFDDTDVTSSIMASPIASINGQSASGQLQNGVGALDHIYRLGITVTFDNGDILHDDIYMSVVSSG